MQRIGAIITILVTVLTLALAWWKEAQTQQSQLKEQLKAAEAALANPDENTRIYSGIRPLEHIAKDSPDYHWTVMQILTRFVRDHARLSFKEPASPTADVANILRVLRERDPSHETADQRLDLQVTNLPYTDLHGAVLQRANLRLVNFGIANLQGVNLSGADLSGTNFFGAALQDAKLRGAKLGMADFLNSKTAPNFTSAHLDRADLRGVDLSQVIGLTRDQMKSAKIDATTILPPYLH
jgi:Pentapeptide repeats (8 copies)